MCLDFVKRHIALVKPQVVLLVGNIASKSLLNTQEGITRMRGQWHELNIEGQKIPALATFHPAYLLRTPIRKREVWHDLCLVAEKLEELKG